MAGETTPPLSTPEFLAGFVPAQTDYQNGVITETEYTDQLEILFSGWGQGGAYLATYTLLVTRLSNFDARMTAMVAAWYSGTATGGPDPSRPGEYPLLTAESEVYWVPSPARLITLMNKGDPGRDALWGIGFFIQYGLGISESYYQHIFTQPGTFDLAKSRAYVRTRATSTTVHKVYKNNADWGTITFGPGSNFGTWAIASPTVVANDVIRFESAATIDPTLRDLSINLVGESNP